MERPSKRPRLSTAAAYDDIPDIDRVRQRNDLRLRGRFESIFAKYDRDFSHITDEIDLVTGDVVVNQGHLDGARHELDIGGGAVRKSILHMPPLASCANKDDRDELSSHMNNGRIAEQDRISNKYSRSGGSQSGVDSSLNGRGTRADSSSRTETLASKIASAVAIDRFDPFNPVSVAELGKNIALQLAQLLRNAQSISNIQRFDQRTPHQQDRIMTPPTSEREHTVSRRRKSLGLSGNPASASNPSQDESQAPRSLNERRQPSVWAGGRSPSPFVVEAITPESGQISRQMGVPEQPTLYKAELRSWSGTELDLLLDLKDQQLAWAQIVPHFPGRSQRAVQDRYYTLLKANPRIREHPQPLVSLHSQSLQALGQGFDQANFRLDQPERPVSPFNLKPSTEEPRSMKSLRGRPSGSYTKPRIDPKIRLEIPDSVKVTVNKSFKGHLSSPLQQGLLQENKLEKADKELNARVGMQHRVDGRSQLPRPGKAPNHRPRRRSSRRSNYATERPLQLEENENSIAIGPPSGILKDGVAQIDEIGTTLTSETVRRSALRPTPTVSPSMTRQRLLRVLIPVRSAPPRPPEPVPKEVTQKASQGHLGSEDELGF